MEAFSKHIPDLKSQFKTVWLLDDRSSVGDRVSMELMMRYYFDDNFQIINFNRDEPLAFVDKFQMLKKISNKDDILFLLEDDWELTRYFNIEHHTNNLRNSDWTQISFTDPLWLQEPYIGQNYRISDEYWRNPFPDVYKHPIKWEGGNCIWVESKFNNYTNNPSLIKAHVYHNTDFKYIRNFEANFADNAKGNHVFYTDCIFLHIGHDSLINKIQYND